MALYPKIWYSSLFPRGDGRTAIACMTGRSLGHRAPLLWLVIPYIAGLAFGHATDFSSVRGQLAIAASAAACAIAFAWRGSKWWGPAIAAAMALAGDASYILHRAR